MRYDEIVKIDRGLIIESKIGQPVVENQIKYFRDIEKNATMGILENICFMIKIEKDILLEKIHNRFPNGHRPTDNESLVIWADLNSKYEFYKYILKTMCKNL